MMKTLMMVVILGCFSLNANAFRCGTHLINEGDTISRMIQLCGQPDVNRGQYFEYINKDSDGMTYEITTDANGIIDNITFSRR